MATKPWRKNAWSFRAGVMCNPATMAFNPGLYPPPSPPPALRHSSPSRRCPPLIFQRLEDSKEEHALRRYANICQNYSQSKEKVKRQCNKSDEELLMENYHLYRTRIENAERLERARGIEDCHSGEQVWAMSLREHWTVEPRIGDLYSTPICYLKEGFEKDIEQIGSPYRENLHLLLSDASVSGKTKQMSTWTLYKRFLKKCEKKLAKVNLYTPDFPALEVVGTKLSAKFATLPEEEVMTRESECVSDQAEDIEASECGWDQPLIGPRAELNTTKLFLHGKPGEHVSSSVILRNTGSTSLHFEWRRQSQLPLCSAEQRGDRAVKDPCFYIIPMSGILVPGESKDLYVEFHPTSPGTFIDSWMLVFSPELSSSFQTLHLLGAAAALENENSTRQRALFQQSLDIKQRIRGLEEIFCEIIENATKQVQVDFKKAPDFISSEHFFDFMRCNIKCFDQTPLYYSPQVYMQFQDLAADINKQEQGILPIDSLSGDESPADALPTRDMSLSNLIARLDMVESDENWKGDMKQKVSSLHVLAAIPPHPTAILHTAMYKTLVKIATQIEEVMEVPDSQSESAESVDSDLGTAFALNEDPVRSPSKQTSANSNVGQTGSGKNLGRRFSKQVLENAAATQDGSVKRFGSSPSRQIFLNANMGPVSSLKGMGGGSPSKQFPANVSAGPSSSLKSVGGGNPSKLVNAASVKGDVSNGGMPEQALPSEVVETVETCETQVRQLLQEGVVEQFWNEVESAVAKLAPIVQRKMDCCNAEGEKDLASWLSLWFIRLSHVFA